MSTKCSILLEDTSEDSIHVYRDCVDDNCYINYQNYKNDVDITFKISEELTDKLNKYNEG